MITFMKAMTLTAEPDCLLHV